MPQLVVNPKGRYCWEASFNPVLRMSHNAIASVMFKMDVERAKYNNILKRLDGDAKTELKITQREMEEVKRELQELRAYQKVAELTAFKKFDPELKRRARVREERERQRQEEEEEERETRELEALKERERDDIHKRLERRQKEQEERRTGINYTDMLLLSRKPSIPDGSDAELAEVQRHKRRLSSTGNVFVTLKDIVDNDNVLQRHSQDVLSVRRPSRDVTPERDAFASSTASRRRGSNVISSSTPNLPQTLEFTGARRRSREAFVSSPQPRDSIDNNDERDGHAEENHVIGAMKSIRRRSRIGSISSLAQQTIQERTANDNEITQTKNNESATANIFITNIPEPDSTKTDQQDKCLLESNPKMAASKKLGLLKAIQSNQDSTCPSPRRGDSSNLSDANNSLKRSKATSPPPIKRQGLFDILGQLQTRKEAGFDETKDGNVVENNENSLDASLAQTTSAPPQPGGLRGLARFKSIATTVTEKNKEAKQGGVARIKKLTAAVIMANCAAQGKLPSAFMLHQLAPAFSSSSKRRTPRLETVHKQPGSLRLRPLQMPKSVQRQHEKKFKELMATINGAVHWKVRALRENTGTLNPRQLRRQKREQEREEQQQQQQQQQLEEKSEQPEQQQQLQQQQQGRRKPRPEVAVRPRRERLALPGACATTWSLKRFVQNEVREVLASWQPENARKLRSQRLKGRMGDLDAVAMGRYRDSQTFNPQHRDT